MPKDSIIRRICIHNIASCSNQHFCSRFSALCILSQRMQRTIGSSEIHSPVTIFDISCSPPCAATPFPFAERMTARENAREGDREDRQGVRRAMSAICLGGNPLCCVFGVGEERNRMIARTMGGFETGVDPGPGEGVVSWWITRINWQLCWKLENSQVVDAELKGVLSWSS